jgi:mannose-1-phosphate guanylyltransferase
MKAFLLAAGLGTRLRPLTDRVPKCLVPIRRRPLLAWWLDLLERHSVERVLVNLHHLPDLVRRFVDSYSGPVSIELVEEPVLLGSAGTLHANQGFVGDDEQFLILYADNLTDVDLTALLTFNEENPAVLTVGLFRSERPAACGIAELDERGVIVAFTEKPERPSSNLASAGVFVGRTGLFRYLDPPAHPYDLGGDVMPLLIGAMNGVEIAGYLRDVGTFEALALAEKEWEVAAP